MKKSEKGTEQGTTESSFELERKTQFNSDLIKRREEPKM